MGAVAEMITKIRDAVNEPSVDAYFDDDKLEREIRTAWSEVYQDINICSEARLIVYYDVSLVADRRIYSLPANVGTILRVGRLATEDGTSDRLRDYIIPKSRFQIGGPGFEIQGHNLVFMSDWNQTDTLRIEYIPNGDVGPIEGTGTMIVDDDSDHHDGTDVLEITTVRVPASPDYGTLDTRDNAYAGMILRITGADWEGASTETVTQERNITSYDPKTRYATISPGLNPLPNNTAPVPPATVPTIDDADLSIDIIPQHTDLCKSAVALKVARKVAAYMGDKTRQGTLNTEYREALRALRMHLANIQKSTTKGMRGLL